MFSRKNLTIVQLLVVVLISASMSSFVPLEFPVLRSTQCEENQFDISNVFKLLEEMLSKQAPSSYPLSYLEVKETLQVAHLDTTHSVMGLGPPTLSTAVWMSSTPALPLSRL